MQRQGAGPGNQPGVDPVVLLEILCMYGRETCMPINVFYNNCPPQVKQRHNIGSLRAMLQDMYPRFFALERGPMGEDMVRAQRNIIAICGIHSQRDGFNVPHQCNALHACRFFLHGEPCKVQDSGRIQCLHGHDLTTSHNTGVLFNSQLHGISLEALQQLMRLSNTARPGVGGPGGQPVGTHAASSNRGGRGGVGGVGGGRGEGEGRGRGEGGRGGGRGRGREGNQPGAGRGVAAVGRNNNQQGGPAGPHQPVKRPGSSVNSERVCPPQQQPPPPPPPQKGPGREHVRPKQPNQQAKQGRPHSLLGDDDAFRRPVQHAEALLRTPDHAMVARNQEAGNSARRGRGRGANRRGQPMPSGPQGKPHVGAINPRGQRKQAKSTQRTASPAPGPIKPQQIPALMSMSMLRICYFYNVKDGCRYGTSGEKCQALHLCRRYLSGECSFGEKCKRSHDVFAAHPRSILTRHGVNMNRPKAQVLADLKLIFHDKKENDKDSDKGKNPTQDNTGKVQPEPEGPANVFTQKELAEILQELKSEIRMARDVKDEKVKTTSRASTDEEDSEDEEEEEADEDDEDDDDDDDDLNVCIDNLVGKCGLGTSCRDYHCTQPYQWQYLDEETPHGQGQQWCDFSSSCNKEIELTYCDPSTTECYSQLESKSGTTSTVFKANFEEMVVEWDKARRNALRRLGTVSSGEGPESQKFTTRWRWYWQDEHDQWRQYGQANPEGLTSSLISEDIEKAYSQDNCGQVAFSIGSTRYILNLELMQQENFESSTTRQVKNRPEYNDMTTGTGKKPRSRARKSSKKVELPTEPTSVDLKLPSNWDSDVYSENPDYQLVPIEKKGKSLREYSDVEQLFLKTMPEGTSITDISRVQNYHLWQAFTVKKTQMERPGKSLLEKHLFHGTQLEYIEPICLQGFDWRISGRSVGNLLGKGSYFAREAGYSKRFTTEGAMFMARTLLGDYTKGDPSYVRPPPKDPTRPDVDLYDSCVDVVTNPMIYVVFSHDQAYPEYLIMFSLPTKQAKPKEKKKKNKKQPQPDTADNASEDLITF